MVAYAEECSFYATEDESPATAFSFCILSLEIPFACFFFLLIAVDEQNAQTLQFELENVKCETVATSTGQKLISSKAPRPEPLILPEIIEPEELSVDSSSVVSPPPSATAFDTCRSLVIPTITTDDMTKDDENDNDLMVSSHGIDIPMLTTNSGRLSQPGRTMASLAVPSYSQTMFSSSDGESSTCSTPGLLSPGQMTPGLFSTEQLNQDFFSPVDCRSPSFDRG
jgi:hypothetical protein